ncbi:MAG TPA: hypothetical protein VG367_19460 [Mucilaginibacter sp.]|jgi:hypothetical protein|nr:hypothetical protein [Mucilaginibacter sp.]
MLKPIIYKDLALGDRFNLAFPDERIPNGFIDKTKTRLGITYTNFHDDRHTITAIPSTAIIDDALGDYDYLKLFPVWEGVAVEDIEGYLKSDAKYKRLVSTPESFGKIIAAAASIGQLPWLYKNVFLYLDEVHCYATEAFRDGILTPFNYAWKFTNMAMGSATPFPFSDPRILNLQRYKVRYKDKFGKVTIVHDSNPKAVLHYMLTHPEQFPGNIHIFFNSVTEIGEAVRAARVTDVSIFCRDDERNMVNLEEAKAYFKLKPVEGEYKRFNFYSCRYNDGWDLKDDSTATLMLVTDVHIPHSLVGIPYKGYQAIGRLKMTPHKIYHITNSFGKEGMKSFEAIQQKWLYNACKHIGYYNTHVAICKQDGIEDNGLLYNMIKPFSTFREDKAELHHMRVDQIICDEYCKEHYSNKETIERTWQSLNYSTEVEAFDLSPVIRLKKSQAEINKQVIERYEEYKTHPERYKYEVASASLKKYKTEFRLLFEAYGILGKPTMERLHYDDKAMKAALIERSNQNEEAKLRLSLVEEFKLNHRYTNKHIKEKLRQLYDQLGIRKPDGSTKTAFAEQLKEFGLFEVNPCKADDEHGKKKPGYEIVKVNYTLKMVA